MLDINKEISGIFEVITSQWDKNTIQISIKETLLQKRKRVSSDEEYYTSLCQNIAYLSESSFPIIKVLESCFKRKSFFETSKAESFITDSQNIIREEMSTLLNQYKSKFRKNTLLESITVAEYSYAYARLRYDMEIDFLFAFIHPNNRATMQPFLNCEPAEFFTSIDEVSNAYANLFINSFEDIFINKNQETKQGVKEEETKEKTIKEEIKEEVAASTENKKKGLFARLFGR